MIYSINVDLILANKFSVDYFMVHRNNRIKRTHAALHSRRERPHSIDIKSTRDHQQANFERNNVIIEANIHTLLNVMQMSTEQRFR